MSLVVNIYYIGQDDNALQFAKEMIDSGIVDRVRQQPGNLRYDYFIPYEDKTVILLIDEWTDQTALDQHHKSEMMKDIAGLRNKYNLKMKVERLNPEVNK